MARSVEQIKKSTKESARRSNPAIDTEKGPFYDWVVQPIADVLPETEAAAERLSQIYSVDFAEVATEEEAQAFLTNWGESAGVGSAAGTIVYFMKYSRPSSDEVVTIQKGSIVSNNDSTLQYVTVEAKSINGVNADSFYNAQRRTYEVGVRVVAVANGSGYELPAGRINRMVTQIRGIDSIENRLRAEGGDEAEDSATQIERVQEKFKGLAINTPDGGIHRVRRFNTAAITDVIPVTSSDRKVFKRRTFKPATDYYIIGETLKEVTQVYVSPSGGEKEIALQYVPCKEISSVLINNVIYTSFYLSQDQSLETGYSARATDKLILDTPLLAGDVVMITLTHNSLMPDIQAGLFSETKLFETDELARECRKIPVGIILMAKSLPNYEPTQVESDTLAILEEFFKVTEHVDEILPSTVLELLKTKVAGISNPTFTKFQRTTLANAEVEMMVFDKNEIPWYDLNYIAVNIRST